MPVPKIPTKLREVCVRLERSVRFRWTLYKWSLCLTPAAAAYVAIATAAQWSVPWLVSLASHFVWPNTAVAVLAAATLKPVRAVGSVAAASGVALLAIAAGQAAPTAEGSGVPLVVATANVLFDNQSTDALKRWLAAVDAEVVGVQEVSPHWRVALEDLKAGYPYQRILEGKDAFGIALLSKWPLENVEVLGEAEFLPRTLVATVIKDGVKARVVVTHPLPPVMPQAYAMQMEQVDLVSRWVQKGQGPVWLMGDLNATPWSAPFLKLQQAGLRSASPVASTWPSRWGGPLRYTGLPGIPFLPIDHVMVGPGVTVQQAHRGPAVGSDHRPLAVTLRLTRPDVAGAR